jgi:small conductance mechanosensitive channel
MLPEHKTKTILQILAGIVLVGMLIASLLNSPLTRHSPLHFVIRGNWTRGINFFSVIAVIVTFCVEYLAYLTVKVVFIMLYSLTDSAGETMLRLVRSFLNYAMFIGAVCVSLSFLGVDTQTLLASIGLLSLAISLGAKDIVADILAGLSIVFERAFSVGDIIQIGDFKGKVLEIGVRSTKVINGTKDIKIFNNHEIGSVINYSKRNTICVVRITLPVDISVDSLEALFEKELPKVREVNPHIVSGPKFNGILEFQNDQMVVGISAEGPEVYIHSIRKDLNRALQSMAERDLLQYAQSNITINVNGAAAKAEDDYSVRDQKEKEEQEDGGETQKEKRIARMIRGFQRNNTENANLKDAVNNMNKEI